MVEESHSFITPAAFSFDTNNHHSAAVPVNKFSVFSFFVGVSLDRHSPVNGGRTRTRMEADVRAERPLAALKFLPPRAPRTPLSVATCQGSVGRSCGVRQPKTPRKQRVPSWIFCWARSPGKPCNSNAMTFLIPSSCLVAYA